MHSNTYSHKTHKTLLRLVLLVIILTVTFTFSVPSAVYGATTDITKMTVAEYKAYLTSLGFPSTYITPLVNLHKKHPTWVFKPAITNLTFASVIDKETKPGINVVAGSLPLSFRSQEYPNYDSSTGTYTSYDTGGWYTATPEVTKYYMDPRNFLTENGIFQFMTHSYDADTQKEAGLKNLVKGTFLANSYPKTSHDSILTAPTTYVKALIKAGKNSKVNPYVLASMIIVEQGSSGYGASISGRESGYEEIFNFFNINAYASGGRTAVENGLIYASGSGSYGRPWNTRYKSILGGAKIYYEEYVGRKQNTLYFKKFNVMNGLSGVATHQYMSNVQGAELEGSRLKKGYDGVTTAITFLIPVYKSMPSKACPYPGSSSSSSSGCTGTVTPADGVNVRAGAGTDYSIVMVLAAGTRVTVTGSAKGTDGYTWYKVSYSGKTGYIRSDFLSISGTVPSSGSSGSSSSSSSTSGTAHWRLSNGYWYYIKADGTKTTGWKTINGVRYYFNSSGVMATGWRELSGKRYYFDSDGAMVKGWKVIGGYYYYFKSTGVMAKNEWVKGYWKLNTVGRWTYKRQGSWHQEGSRWWFGDTSGWYAKSETLTIDGKQYKFNSGGWLVE